MAKVYVRRTIRPTRDRRNAGWRGNISGCRKFEELPKEAQQYVKRIEQLCGAPIKLVSVGAERAATLVR
jgi:adenylosuccinate synthase